MSRALFGPRSPGSGALCPEITAQPVHGMGIEVCTRGMRQVRVHVQRFWRGDALEDWENSGGGTDVVTHTHVDQRRALNRRGEIPRVKVSQRVQDGLPCL